MAKFYGVRNAPWQDEEENYFGRHCSMVPAVGAVGYVYRNEPRYRAVETVGLSPQVLVRMGLPYKKPPRVKRNPDRVHRGKLRKWIRRWRHE